MSIEGIGYDLGKMNVQVLIVEMGWIEKFIMIKMN